MTPAITIEEVRKLNPCEDAMTRLEATMPKRRKLTAALARQHGATLDDLIWVATSLASRNKDVERRLRMWMADCAARVLPIFEANRPEDDRPRKAVEAARLYANGKIKSCGQTALWIEATDAAWDTRVAAMAAPAAEWSAEKEWQLDRFIRWFSDDEPTPLPVTKEAVA